MAYGLPATVAAAAAPGEARVTLVTVSPFSSPLAVNSVPANTTAWPYVLVRSSAVTTRAAGVTSNDALVVPTRPALVASRVKVPT